MSARRFVGANSREAMRLVRSVLGDDALILSNRQTAEGVEILALEAEISEAPGDTENTVAARILGDAGGSATRNDCWRELLVRAGLSLSLADDLLIAMPEELTMPGASEGVALDWLRHQLQMRLRTLQDEDDFLDVPGAVAVTGPTGVGKTTVAASLAAYFAGRHGVGQVALVRIGQQASGGHELLRSQARTQGIAFYTLEGNQPWSQLDVSLWEHPYIVIDTAGASQRDRRLVEQMAHLRRAPVALRPILLLNAASQPEALAEVMTAYRSALRAAGSILRDCIITKVDESGRLGPCLDGILAANWRILFVSKGQDIATDLVAAGAAPLVEMMFSTAPKLTRKPLGALVAAPERSSRKVLGQVRRAPRLIANLRRHVAGFTALEAAWKLDQLPVALQAGGIDALLDEARAWEEKAVGILWARRSAVTGADWPMPDLVLHSHHHWSVFPLLRHRQPPGQEEKLAWADASFGAGVHLLAAVPDAAAWRWLTTKKRAWLAAARGSQKVFHCSVRQELSQLTDRASEMYRGASLYKGQAATLVLSQLAVTAAPVGRRARSDSYPVTAWFADWYAEDTGLILSRRHWLSMSMAEEAIADLIALQLRADTLPALMRAARKSLHELYRADIHRELLLLLSCGLAATATLLAQSREGWARELRAELVSLLGGRYRATAPRLLEGLLSLLTLRDGLRHLDAADLSGVF